MITRQDKNQAQAIATQLILQYNFVIIIATQNDIIALCYDSCALCADTISTLCPFFLHLLLFVSREHIPRQRFTSDKNTSSPQIQSTPCAFRYRAYKSRELGFSQTPCYSTHCGQRPPTLSSSTVTLTTPAPVGPQRVRPSH